MSKPPAIKARRPGSAGASVAGELAPCEAAWAAAVFSAVRSARAARALSVVVSRAGISSVNSTENDDPKALMSASALSMTSMTCMPPGSCSQPSQWAQTSVPSAAR